MAPVLQQKADELSNGVRFEVLQAHYSAQLNSRRLRKYILNISSVKSLVDGAELGQPAGNPAASQLATTAQTSNDTVLPAKCPPLQLQLHCLWRKVQCLLHRCTRRIKSFKAREKENCHQNVPSNYGLKVELLLLHALPFPSPPGWEERGRIIHLYSSTSLMFIRESKHASKTRTKHSRQTCDAINVTGANI